MHTRLPDDGVVVGVDGTRTALGAVRWAAREADLRRVPLRIVHAAPYATGSAEFAVRRARDILAVAYTHARHTVPGVPASTHLAHTGAAETLIRAAEHADLLVLGQSGGAFPLDGRASVALEVAGRAVAPTVVLRGHARDDGPVVAGVDTPERDGAVLDVALAEATLHRTGLVIVHATHSRDAYAGLADAVAALRERAPQVPIELRTPSGGPTAALIAAAVTARLVVIGNRRHGVRALLGSHSRDLLRAAPAPVLVVNPTPSTSEAAPTPTAEVAR